jgi:predicted secreted hydrolase
MAASILGYRAAFEGFRILGHSYSQTISVRLMDMVLRWIVLIWIVLMVLLSACLPQLQGYRADYTPTGETWAPQVSPLEWWYVSGYLPEEKLSFHWAMFKGYTPPEFRVSGIPVAYVLPGPFYASHIVLTDLDTNQKVFDERFDFPKEGVASEGLPLKLQHGDWRLVQEGNSYRLSAGPIQLNLKPSRPAVVHPPGYSGNAETGRMYYVSFTRLDMEGKLGGRSVKGQAWMDHQWGEQISAMGLNALWDWFGLHLSNGYDLMLYRVKNRKGEVVQLAGSATAPNGEVAEVKNLSMIPLETWTSASGRSYALSWKIEGQGFGFTLNPARKEQELLTTSTRVAYWEGPVLGKGTWGSQAIEVHGMGEFVAGIYGWPSQSELPPMAPHAGLVGGD